MTDRFTFLSPEALEEALAAPRAPVLVDVRTSDGFAAGHIPGSRNVPVHDLGARRADLPASLAERVIVIGDHYKRTVAAARFLVLIGFGDVSILDGGIAAWEGMLETGMPPPRRSGPELRVVPSDDGS